MEHLEDKLAAQLYRLTCPDSTELGEYQLKLLPDARRLFVRDHLAQCPHCRSELTTLQAYLTDLAPDLEYSLADHIKIWLARLLPPDNRTLAPAFALRGEGSEPLIYEAGEAQLTIEVQDDLDQPGNKVVLGLLLGVDVTDFYVHLWQDGARLVTVPVDDLGNFTLTTLSPGHYELILSGPAVEIHVQELVV